VKRSSWWIWSLLVGLAASAVVGWRVISQRHEVERQQIENSLTSIDRAALEGRVSETNPVSAQQLALANRLKRALAVPENESGIHPVNRPTFTYWEGWARLNSGLNAIDEALGSRGRSADPRPDTYINAWEVVEAAIADSNFDIPASLAGEDYQRFREHIAKQEMLVSDTELVEALGLTLVDREGTRVLRSADQGALEAIGASMSTTKPDKADLSVLVAGEPVSVQQREFLSTRLAVLKKAEDASLRLARRFSELNLPEHEWQHRRVVTEDIQLPGSKFTMRSLVGQALGARKRQVAALGRMLNDPLNTDLIDRLNQERDLYRTAIEKLGKEVMEAAPLAASVMANPAEDVPSKFDDLRDQNLRRLGVLARELESLEDFDPELEKDRAIEDVRDPVKAEQLVADQAQRIATEREYIRKSRQIRLERVALALDAIRDFPNRVLDMGGVAGANHETDTLGDFTDADLKLILSDGGPFSLFLEGVPKDDIDAFAGALRRLLLADLSVIRAESALIMGAADKAMSGLGQVTTDLSLVRETVLSRFPTHTERTRKRLEGVEDETLDQQIRANLLFLAELGAEYVAKARAPVGPSQAERALYTALADEFSTMRNTLIRAGFSHAEFSHQLFIEHLREMTSDRRPIVTFGAADKARLAWLMWERGVLQYQAGDRETEPKHPLETIDFNASPELRELKRYMDSEVKYRELRDSAIREYQAYLDSENPEVARRALLGIATLKVEDINFQFGWKHRHGHSRETANETNGSRSPAYGIFSYVEEAPPRIASSASAMAHPRGGSWLGYQETVDHYRRGPSPTQVREIEKMLETLRDGTPGASQDIFVACRWLSGRLMEHVPLSRTRSALGAANYYLGDLPGALLTYYIPLLKGPNGASDESIVRNRYIPLDVEFQRINDKLKHMTESVDENDPAALTALFLALAPSPDGKTPDEDEISRFWGEYFEGVASRGPGLVRLQDALYDFNYRLAGLAERRAELLLSDARTDSRDLKAQAALAQERARGLYRAAGKVLFEHAARYPDEPGVARHHFRIGDAYFKSGDYVFAINAYKEYYRDRITSDRRFEMAEPYYVVNRIGEAYMHLGMNEGAAMRAAIESKDNNAIALESAPETMTIDAAIPAFEWNIMRTRRLMLDAGEGGLPRGSLPPAGALSSFINMAAAKIQAGRIRAARGDTSGITMLEDAIKLLRSDLIEARLFPSPVTGFNESLYYRDAQFQIGQAELELARAHRSLDAAQRDTAVFHGHLRRSAEAYDDILMNWPQPQNRAVLIRATERGRNLEDAMHEVGGGSARFSDDVYYLTILGRSEADWLKAVHHPDPLSTEVVDLLTASKSRLKMLNQELDAIHGKDAPVKGTTFGFPELSRRARFLFADVTYLEARTQRDRMDGGGSDRFTVIDRYKDAIAAYEAARGLHPHVYEALWAYAQELNCHRALSAWRPDHEAEARRMLAAADTFMDAMPNAAFDAAPSDMTREAFAEYFKWYDLLARG